MIDTESTFIVHPHLHPGGWAKIKMVGRNYRCGHCGHRLHTSLGRAIASRKMPFWTWHRELLDRRRARNA